MAAPRSRKWKADGQLSFGIVFFFFFQGNQVRKRPGVSQSHLLPISAGDLLHVYLVSVLALLAL